jgi:hypothetical protein
MSDVQLGTGEELSLVGDEYIAVASERTTLQRVTASLSASSLADEDIREHLQSRLRALEKSLEQWHSLAVFAFERRVWRAVGANARAGG